MQAFVERRNHNLLVYNDSALSTKLEKLRVHKFVKSSCKRAVTPNGAKTFQTVDSQDCAFQSHHLRRVAQMNKGAELKSV